MISDWSKYEHFSEWEFDSPDVPGSGSYMDEETMDMLAFAREVSNQYMYCPYPINSGCRSDWYNEKIGGVWDSAHKYILKDDKTLLKPSFGVDVGITKQTFAEVIRGLRTAGFQRFGVNMTGHVKHWFVHTDNDPNKTKPTSWGYPIIKPHYLSTEPSEHDR